MHKEVRTAMIYLHVMNKPGLNVKSTVDLMERVRGEVFGFRMAHEDSLFCASGLY